MKRFLISACLMFVLTGCEEPPFRCSKCKSETKLKYMSYYDGKKISWRWYPMTEWVCQDAVTHEKEKRVKE